MYCVCYITCTKPYNVQTNEGFGFVEFTSHHAVEVLLADPYHTICGKQVRVIFIYRNLPFFVTSGKN